MDKELSKIFLIYWIFIMLKILFIDFINELYLKIVLEVELEIDFEGWMWGERED